MENYWEDFDEEESSAEIENIENQIEDLNEMYQHSLELIRLNGDEKDIFDLDFDLFSLRNTIDNRITDLEETKENIKLHIEMLRDNTNDYLDYEYRHNKLDY